MCTGSSNSAYYEFMYQQQKRQPPSEADAKEAGVALARLMERQLGYPEGRIDNVALRLFIRAYWSRVSAYAHTIHDSRD